MVIEVLTRRRFIKWLGVCSTTPWLVAESFKADASSTVFFAAAQQGDQYYLHALNDQAHIIHSWPLPDRGHDIAITRKYIVVLARRPSRWMFIISRPDFRQYHFVYSVKGRHFYGHGVFDESARYFYTTENDYQCGQGVIGIYDVKDDFKRVGEWSSFGIGPHQLKFLPDNRTLVVANGGIKTHPNQPRKQLNLETMNSSLAYVDKVSGNLKDLFESKVPRASIRHLDVAPSGEVVAAIQYQRDGFSIQDTCSLLLFHQQGEDVFWPETNGEFWLPYQDYIASVAIEPKSRVVCITSPRGHLVSGWCMDEKTCRYQMNIRDASGVERVPQKQEFLVSSGTGTVTRINSITGERLGTSSVNKLAWDNHLSAERFW